MEIRIGKKRIGDANPCFIIAEAGVNHNGDVETAKRLIDAARDAGCDAVKFQTFNSGNLVTDKASMAGYQEANTGRCESQLEMLKNLELTYSDFCELKRYCDKKNIIFLSTPHSGNEDIDLVAKLCPAIKIASGDLTNIPFLEYAAKKGRPLIIGTGMGTMREVREAVKAIRKHNQDIILLHCTSSYPTSPKDVNLRAMQTMRKAFKTQVGYSDHTLGIIAPLAAVSLGASVIEKHYTLSRKMEGPDHKASIEPCELKELVQSVRLVEEMLGSQEKKPTKQEKETSKVGRKSIVARVNIAKGERITEDMLSIKRPGTGLSPSLMKKIIGRKAVKGIGKDEVIKSDMIANVKKK